MNFQFPFYLCFICVYFPNTNSKNIKMLVRQIWLPVPKYHEFWKFSRVDSGKLGLNVKNMVQFIIPQAQTAHTTTAKSLDPFSLLPYKSIK